MLTQLYTGRGRTAYLAARIVETAEGGFVLSDYGDGEAIGVPLWKKEVMLEAFREFDPYR